MREMKEVLKTVAQTPTEISLEKITETPSQVEVVTVDQYASPAPVLRVQGQSTENGVSPLNFPSCPRGPGRPKGRVGAPKLVKKTASVDSTPKKRGRPAKVSESNEDEPVIKKRRGRPPKFNYAPDDKCAICGFELDHKTKKNKPKIACEDCGKILHKPCLTKNEKCVCKL